MCQIARSPPPLAFSSTISGEQLQATSLAMSFTSRLTCNACIPGSAPHAGCPVHARAAGEHQNIPTPRKTGKTPIMIFCMTDLVVSNAADTLRAQAPSLTVYPGSASSSRSGSPSCEANISVRRASSPDSVDFAATGSQFSALEEDPPDELEI